MIIISFSLRRSCRLRSRSLQRLRAIGFDDPVHALLVEPGFAGGDFPDAAHQQLRRNGPGQDAAHAAAKIVDGFLFAGALCDHDQLRSGQARRRTSLMASAGLGESPASNRMTSAGVVATAFKRLRQGFGLGDDLQILLQREDLAHANTEDGLRIGQNDPDRLRTRTRSTLADEGRHRLAERPLLRPSGLPPFRTA